MKNVLSFCSKILMSFCLCLSLTVSVRAEEPSALEEYREYFDEVFHTVQDNYYKTINAEVYETWLENWESKIFDQLKSSGKSNDYIRWRSASYMVQHLRDPDDEFSELYPPKPAKEYEQTALGKRIDLGIEGEKIKKGFRVTHIEPRSDAYVKGLREEDVIVRINKTKLKNVEQAEIEELLKPLEGSTVQLQYIRPEDKKKNTIEIISRSYYKQTVFMSDPFIPGIAVLELRKFNRKTSDDMLLHLMKVKEMGAQALIIDLRGNPGGPPLAAREISSFFLTPGDEFAYFKKKDEKLAHLDVPVIPEKYRFTGPIVLLVNKDSGSAAELFSGVMQHKDRAVILGQNTAGSVFLKSMFPLSDESMVLLVTARGHQSDGTKFSFDGVTPDEFVPPEHMDEMQELAAKYLYIKHFHQQ